MQSLYETTSELEKQTSTSLYEPNGSHRTKSNETVDFSYFSKPIQNVIPTGIMSIQDAHQAITDERYARETRILRTITNKEMARNYKAHNFDFVCFSGIFSRRCEAGLIHPSSLLTLDFDRILNPLQLKYDLLSNSFFETVLAFISPSGDGVKWIIKIDLNLMTHLQWFQAVANYVKRDYHLEIDQSGKDVCRCCFLPYDREAYINEKYG